MFRASLKPAVFVFLFLIGCFSETGKAQDANIIGPVTVEELLSQDRIYDIYVQRYKPDAKALDFLNSVEDSVTLKIFFGSWCKESKKYIPGLIKFLQVLSAHNITADYIGVDPQKKSPDLFLKEFDIGYIPTVVVLKGTDEIGRIEEIPQNRIETELVQILKQVQSNTSIIED